MIYVYILALNYCNFLSRAAKIAEKMRKGSTFILGAHMWIILNCESDQGVQRKESVDSIHNMSNSELIAKASNNYKKYEP